MRSRRERTIREGTVSLDDGRTLGYREYGERSGAPIVYLHGMPGSRLDLVGLEEDYRRLGVWVVAVERSGYGLSTARRSWRLLDWPEDVAALADRLGIERFAVMGFSSGGKYAAACAYALPERATRVAIVSGVGPPETPRFRQGLGRTVRLSMTLARRARPLAVGFWSAGRWLTAHRPESFVNAFERELSEPDRAILAESQVRQAVQATFREALRADSQGAIEDSVHLTRPWGFDLEEIQVPVHIWHGDRDENVPLHHARYAAETIPNATLTVLEGAGHLALMSYGAEIVAALID